MSTGPSGTTTSLLRRPTAAALALLCAAAAPARAQDPVPDSARAGVVCPPRGPCFFHVDADRRFAASPLLPEDHWAVRAARRAEALGLAPEFFPAQRAVPRQAVASALIHAGARAGERDPRLAAMVRGWWGRFVEEFPEYPPLAHPGVVLTPLGRALSVGYVDEEGRLSPAVGYAGTRQPPAELADRGKAFLGGAAGVAVSDVAALALEVRADPDLARVRRWEAVAGAGDFQLSFGRGDVGYGYGRGGGVVLSYARPLTRLELSTTRPSRLPGFLDDLGDWSAHTFVARMDEARHPTEPWLWGMRVALRPHPRLTLAANRASIFGGDGRAVTLERAAKMAVGVIRDSDFENTIVSGEVRWRVPTDRVLPATLYLEWGADDGAGGIDEMPGRVAGIYLPALPGVPQVGVGAEYAEIAEACCGHGPWYFSATFPGNWARGDRLLAHPIGGEGWEASGYAQAELLDARLRLDGRFFVRERSDASLSAFGGGNLFAPARVGRSTGGEVEAAFRVGRFGDLRAGFFRDAGEGWREQRFHADVAVFF